ncbi:MAG: hypothetical protein ACREP9_22425, partial [Candidatus Dormibacteraceae bacterium]
GRLRGGQTCSPLNPAHRTIHPHYATFPGHGHLDPTQLERERDLRTIIDPYDRQANFAGSIIERAEEHDHGTGLELPQ